MAQIWQGLLDLVYPPQCCLCGRLGEPLCHDCRAELPAEKGHQHLRPEGDRLSQVHSLFPFRDIPARMVKRLKYSQTTGLAQPMSRMMASYWADHPVLLADAIIPIPLHARRLRDRGFNQAALLADEFDPGLRRDGWLVRSRATKPQVGLSRGERLRNLEGAFIAMPEVAGKVILLIDDVTTTGGTVVACTEALWEQKAAEVKVLTFCGNRDGDPED